LPAPLNSQYYAGVIMVVIYSGSLLGLRFYNSVMITTVIVAAYQVVSTSINPIPTIDWISNNFFLGMATGVGLFCSYILETHARNNYIAQKIIETKNQVMQALLSEAEAANRAKSEFLAVMSHELRTPLNAILGFSEMFKEQMLGPLGSAKYVEYAGDIHSSGKHLLAIISDILDLAKAESGKLELSESDFDINEMITSTLRLFQTTADEDGTRLEFTPGPSHLHVHADERLVRQVALNLISNAMKFTHPGGTITIDVQASYQTGVVLTVQDTGIGIAAENLDRVLRPFEQVASAFSRSHGGTGLGLPYSKKVVEIHGGMLRLSSRLGIGTSVRVELPAGRVRMAQADKAEPAQEALQATG
jgi:signal transduction histidine kinase